MNDTPLSEFILNIATHYFTSLAKFVRKCSRVAISKHTKEFHLNFYFSLN